MPATAPGAGVAPPIAGASLRARLVSLGPGAVFAAAFIGPGTVTTATLAGARHGFTLLWALTFLTFATVVLQEMSARLGPGTEGGVRGAVGGGVERAVGVDGRTAREGGRIMSRRWMPQPSERAAWEYRRAHRIQDFEPVGRYERAGFMGPDGYRGAYADRPEYRMPRGMLYPPEPEGSGWPHELHHVSRAVTERHRRALQDRELARAVDRALYLVLPQDQADRISVYADDAVITLAGRVEHPAVARAAHDAARRIRGVRRVRNALTWSRRGSMRPPGRPRMRRRGGRFAPEFRGARTGRPHPGGW